MKEVYLHRYSKAIPAAFLSIVALSACNNNSMEPSEPKPTSISDEAGQKFSDDFLKWNNKKMEEAKNKRLAKENTLED